MVRRSRKKIDTHTKEAIKRYAPYVVILLAVLLLVLIIVLVGVNRSHKQEKSDYSGMGASEETGSSAEAETKALDLTKYHLGQDEVPDLTALVQTYCQAKADSDPETLERVFGKEGLSQEELEAERVKLEQVGRLVEGYEKAACYTVEGLEPDTYVVYPYFEIQYKGAHALVPSLTWSYAKKDAQGRFYLTMDLTDKEAEHVKEVSRLEDVKNLSQKVEKERQEAIAGDMVLQQIYLGTSVTDGTKPDKAESEGAEPDVAQPDGTEPGGAQPDGTEPGGLKSDGTEPGGAQPGNTAGAGSVVEIPAMNKPQGAAETEH